MKHDWINVKKTHHHPYPPLPQKKPPKTKELTVGEIKNAELQILAQPQMECYHEELNSSTKIQYLVSLRPMLTGNLLRVEEVEVQPFLSFDSNHQINLSKKQHLSELLIKDIHIETVIPEENSPLIF